MSAERETRCPYCNGTGSLPFERVRAIEADRDEFALRKEITSRLWGALSDLAVCADRKSATLERLRVAVRESHRALAKFMTLDRIAGR